MTGFPVRLLSAVTTVIAAMASGRGVAAGDGISLNGVPFIEKMIRSTAGTVVRTYSTTSSDRVGLTYVAVETGCNPCATGVRVVDRFGSSHDIYRQATPPDAAIAVNGSFFGYDLKGRHVPLGLVIEDGVRKNRRIGWQHGGFLVHSSDRQTRIIPVAKYRQKISDSGVVQSKPLLVEDGHNGIRSDDQERFNRTAVAITTSGKLIVAGAFEGFGRSVSLHEFAVFLLAIRCSDGSTIRWALAMDGGPGAQIYVPALKLQFGDPGQNYVPNLVYVR